MTAKIAIVGMACRYPDAASPEALWENVLSGRRAFRRLPPERICLADYFSPERAAPDRFYAAKAAVLDGYEFDRVAFRVAGSTFRSTDLAHWLALDVAAGALADAGFPDGNGLPRESTGVLVGNTLTGEFSRAGNLRLRWPYVRRVLTSALQADGWAAERSEKLLADVEERFKAPFPAVDGDTLAGALSNTIAGRICNHFDLGGGGYTVDGACSASLLSVTTACAGLLDGDLDVAIAGGVDLSIDPFELVGFAKAGALADADMRVYDRRSAGFWPGEGCGMVVLMRADDALSQNLRTYALIRGWGVSSDGSGGMTRPEADGQLLAVRRAYRRAGFGIDTVGYFEGHGTGTEVGDRTELDVLSRARRAAHARAPAAVGTVKANIGHTKAAAGVAGLIKATLAVHELVLPPTTGCIDPHPLLAEPEPALRVLFRGEPWPDDEPVRAAVSSMGFGGINVHLVIEAPDRRIRRPAATRMLPARQDVELFLLSAASTADLAGRVRRLAATAPALSHAELTDLAMSLRSAHGDHPVRAAVVAGTPEELDQRLGLLLGWLDGRMRRRIDQAAGVFLGAGPTPPAIRYLFPGQGTGSRPAAEGLRRRFETVDQLYASVGLPRADDSVATDTAQPRIVAASLAALRALRLVGIDATAAVGHSLGELTALHWAGAMEEQALVRLAAVRGRLMVHQCAQAGAMASLTAEPADVEPLLAREPVVLACFNTARLTVVSGESAAVDRVVAAARRRGITAMRLPVSHAFHSPLLAEAGESFAAHLAHEPLRPLRRTVISTVTGRALPAEADLRELLRRQVTEPVRFAEAVQTAAADADLLIEVGPGSTLSRFAAECTATPAVALATDSTSLAGFLGAVGAAFALGHPVRPEALFADRFSRPLDLDRERRFLANPCESAPDVLPDVERSSAPPDTTAVPEDAALSTVDLVRQLIATHAELPVDAVGASSHLLDELHLSSIAIGQIVVEACRQLELPPPAAASAYANATVAQVAEALDTIKAAGGSREEPAQIAGLAPWVRSFSVAHVPVPLPAPDETSHNGQWQVFAPDGHPFAGPLAQALKGVGDGVLVCGVNDDPVVPLLNAARAALSPEGPNRFVVVGCGPGVVAFAKTLHLEAPAVRTTVVDVPLVPQAIPWIVAEVAATRAFAEASYDSDSTRRVPVLRPLPAADPAARLPLSSSDVLLVTGGGKGITAECALALGRETGCRLALLGRADPAGDPALAENLRRVAAAGIEHRYVRADVTDEEEVRRAVAETEAALGTVTGVLHGAGGNAPELLGRLTEPAFQATLAPKVAGLRAVLGAVDKDALRLLVTFGSIIGRAGLPGEAAYAVANASLSDLTERFRDERPDCRCLAVEWSVWSGVGMGERLGVVEALARDGVTPIGVDEGVAILCGLLAMPDIPTTVIVTGRVDGLPTIRADTAELPLARFLERPRVHYPGIELIADAELSTVTDPYLDDHVLDGQRLLPGVIGMEALAQAAMAVTGSVQPPALERIAFARPIVVPAGDQTTVRVAALVNGSGVVEVALRSSETNFEVDHVRAVCRFGTYTPPRVDGLTDAPAVPIDPDRELYGGLLFQAGRFRRVRRYRLLRATECAAEIAAGDGTPWFGPYLPARLVLGDPGARDACLHAVQCCVPDRTLVPVAVERFTRYDAAPGQVTVHAEERGHDGDEFTYDLAVVDESGAVAEAWRGLRLRTVRGRPVTSALPSALLGPYLERGLAESASVTGIAVVTDPVPGSTTVDHRASSECAIQRALGRRTPVLHRPDGRPEVVGEGFVSAAHGESLVLGVAGPQPVACDTELIVERPAEAWAGLVGSDGTALAREIADATGEPDSAALTRVWSAYECVRKAERWSVTPSALVSAKPGGWVVLTVGPALIATLVTALPTGAHTTFAILTERADTAWTPTNTATVSDSRRPTSSATSTSSTTSAGKAAAGSSSYATTPPTSWPPSPTTSAS